MIEDHDHEYRSGIGTDIHTTRAGLKLMLGGVYIESPFGLAGYSDGDVAIHAVIDALLGAAGLGDIGSHFPDTDPQYKDADSKRLLVTVKELLEKDRWIIVNIDLIINAQAPRLEEIKLQIKRSIAGLSGIDFTACNVKAKTNEGLGDIGQGRAISAIAITLLKRKYKRTL